jgi:hypothetical protein
VPTKDDLIKDLDWVTQRVSDRVWSISAGTIAIALGYFVEGAKKDGEPFLRPELVAGPAALALLSLICDLAQYVAANRLQRKLLARMEEAEENQMDYDPSDLMYVLRGLFYNLKMFLCFAGAIWLVVISGWRVITLL